MKKCTGTIDNKNKKKQGVESKIFLETFKKKPTIFLRDPKRRLIKENQEK